ncbi:hypothetical protein SAMN05216312_108279 [Cohnella sp. OV330]|uniref:hypothetical protein n=1 Tax=Cohnella sp. OV330 TaxID=1855288 RepID=UPI0008E90267|nr:hypothetical protein [Cohnella sp. OV330]SFB45192.1 hypothetical protein SAMN05216312_108279 [Cohnella sp. OV330]
MVKTLNGLAVFLIIAGIISGIVQGLSGFDGFRWGPAFLMWIGGFIAGILFLAIAVILDYVEDTNDRIRHLEFELIQKNASPALPSKLGNSRANLSNLSGFKLGSREE